MEEYDLIVIGAGSGLDVASAFASRGKSVAVIEPGPLGGTCLNRGCIPSKMLIHRADVVKEIQNSEKFGIEASVDDIHFSEMVEEVNEEVRQDSKNIEEGIKASENHTLYRTEAEFIDNSTLEVDGEKITADKIVVAAGTRPFIPPIDGIEDVDYMTSKEALEMTEKPDDMIVVGGGYISNELAHFFEAMGIDVTILERGERLLRNEDREVSIKYTELASERFNVELETEASEVYEEDGRTIVVADGKEYEADELFIAAGRVPNTDSLKVGNTDIETDESGYIEVDEYMNTSVDHIYALGDIIGKHPFKHAANKEANVALINAFVGNKKEIDYTAMPHAVFSAPQIAGVGKTEQELEEEDTEYVKASYEYEKTGMGMALKDEDGFVKVLASEEGEILGCHIIGPHASQQIHEVLVAMKAGSGTVSDIQDTIHIHPALNEVVQRAFNQL
ncbi:dihydrolipoyl dehydrogenase [Candidatus Nanosalina sp. VS9-1]|uniref:dihydrolipoyl dehydrogenase n=1 Tax=Candidatus Nanosalina sp. VS9-1 TaxID=3388566 RepID=UPI0039E1235D